MNERELPPPIPLHMAPVLERVLTGAVTEMTAEWVLGVSENELGILLRALIRQRAREQGDYTD